MKRYLIMGIMGMCLFWATAMECVAQSVAYKPFKHYTDRVKEFDRMRAVDSTDIVMLGNSLTEFAGDWNILLKAKHVRNRGIAGDDAEGIRHRLDQILPGRPKAVFLMVGINDLSHDLTAEQVARLAIGVITDIRTKAPGTRLYVQSLLPINESYGKWKTLEGKTDVVPQINRMIEHHCKRHDIDFVNLYPHFIRKGTNDLRDELTQDGLHLSAHGYKVWAFLLGRYFRELQ